MSSKVSRVPVVGLAALFAAALVSPAHANAIALKRDAGLTHADPIGTGNGDASVLHATFQALGAGDVVLATVKDAYINHGNPAAGHPYMNYGATGNSAGGPYFLFEFDLSAAPGLVGGTVARAELRLFFGGTGNTGFQAGRILTAWSEGNKDGGYPGAAPAAPGASEKHPNGLNTGMNQLANGTPGTTGSWQSGDLSVTGATGDTGSGLDGDMARNRKAGVNNRWMVFDVTNIAQSWATGAGANRGIWYRNSNYQIRLSEAGTDREPVLFIDYAPKVPKGTFVIIR
jgi:hypothetical protein